MPGRDEQFQHDLRKAEAQARANGEENTLREQMIARALAERTETSVVIRGASVSLLRLTDPEKEDEFAGVILLLHDQAFNVKYVWQLSAEDAVNFSKDWIATLNGGQDDE